MKESARIMDIKIGIVGAGSWGTALANLLADKGYIVSLWVFESEVEKQILNERENKIFLPGVKLSERLMPSGDLAHVVSGKDLLLVVVPSHVMRETSEKFSRYVPENTLVVSASKGIENITHLTMSQVLRETIPHIAENRFAVLSGPSFAKEVAGKVPTLISVASKDPEAASFIQRVFATTYFRVYTNNDMMGVELGGAVKNVIAIASGIIDGLGLGLNTRAALITRVLTEIRRLGTHMGARPDTFAGLSGIGDLLLTCTGALSRNYTVGKKIGEGKKANEILSEMRMVAEGVKTAKSVYNLSRKLNVDMPICHEIYRILYEDDSPVAAVRRLMTRDLKNELDD
jgi:glycerol-3-phosphate dehydrogenase (NAD(P)+)